MHTEAPASVTYNIETPSGFNILYTLRGKDQEELLELMKVAEKNFADRGYSGGSQKMTVKKPYTGASSYTPNSGDGATPKQVEILKDWGLWKDGTTKQEASKIISEKLKK